MNEQTHQREIERKKEQYFQYETVFLFRVGEFVESKRVGEINSLHR